MSMENACTITCNPRLSSSAIPPKTAAARLRFSTVEHRPCWRSYRFAVKSAGSINSAVVDNEPGQGAELVNVEPVYQPTPPNRPLRTPHSGYHFDGTARKFFEGWYFKVSIPECRQSFCFMYSVESPSFTKKLSKLEEAQYGPRFTGVGAQILGVDDKYICQYTEESQNFWGNRDELMLGNTFVAQKDMRPPKKEVPPQEFNQRVLEGFQVTPLWHQGFIRDDGRGVCQRINFERLLLERSSFIRNILFKL